MTKTTEQTPLEKAIGKAFDYFPFGFEKVNVYREWACGPVFMARIPEEQVALNILSSPSGFKQDALWEKKAEAILEGSDNAKIILSVDKNGHPRERETKKDKFGADVEFGPAKCTGRALSDPDGPFAELPFPLFALGRTLRVDQYRMETVGSPIYGFDENGALVVTLAPRLLDTQCRPLSTEEDQ